MRVFNQERLSQDIGAAFKYSSTDEDGRFVQWLVNAFSKKLIKSPPAGMFHPITVKRPPSFIEGLDVKPYLVAKVPRFGDQKLSVQSEFDIKDAEAGTIVYYMPTESTVEAFRATIVPIRDFFLGDVLLRDNMDLRRLSFDDTVRAAEQWHEQIAREARRRAEEWARRMESDSAHPDAITEPKVGTDWLQVGEFLVTGSGNPLVIHRMITRNALRYESMQMEHCVHTYANRLLDSELILCTVRHAGKVEKPVATFELYLEPHNRKVTIVQVKGKCNSNPDDMIPGVVKLITDRIKTTEWFQVSRETHPARLSVETDKTTGDLSVAIRTGNPRPN